MPYIVKEIYYTLQGEGVNAGRPAVFLRFAGCNLWSGHEKDRAAAQCRFCDTDFLGTSGENGGRFEEASQLVELVASLWPEERHRFVVCTGGEPLLQLDQALVDALHAHQFQIAVETNGTVAPPNGLDWICVSPKAGTSLRVRAGNELKLIFPQPEAPPSFFERLRFEHFLLQPMDGPRRVEYTQRAIEYCKAHPQWRLSLQTHKMIGLP